MSSGRGLAEVATTGPLARLLPGLVTGLIAVLVVPAPATAIDEFPVPPGTNPGGITAANGSLWFVGEGTSRIYRMTTVGALDPAAGFPVTITGSDTSQNTLDQIVAGPDGALWFTQPRDNQIGRMTTAGAVTNEFTLPASLEEPEGITVGPDGALWFTAGRHRQDRADHDRGRRLPLYRLPVYRGRRRRAFRRHRGTRWAALVHRRGR